MQDTRFNAVLKTVVLDKELKSGSSNGRAWNMALIRYLQDSNYGELVIDKDAMEVFNVVEKGKEYTFEIVVNKTYDFKKSQPACYIQIVGIVPATK